MDTFNTSNGNQVRMRETGVLAVSVAKNSIHDWCLGTDGVADLREFFQAERDEQLGRWRWPDDPRYLVFPLKDDDEVRVLDENSGQSAAIRRSSFRSGLTHTHFVGAALAYFDAHPEPKPWHDAKIGEVWLLDFASQTRPAIVVEDDGASWFMVADDISILSRFKLSSEAFTDARRIFPEVAK